MFQRLEDDFQSLGFAILFLRDYSMAAVRKGVIKTGTTVGPDFARPKAVGEISFDLSNRSDSIFPFTAR